jgi:uncharacterized protein
MPVKLSDLFDKPKPLIAMIHTGPSPGVPGFVCVDSAVERAAAEAELYLSMGVDGILVENMRDFPGLQESRLGPEVAAFMTRVAYAVKRRARHVPVGVAVLGQACQTALAVAVAARCDFVRTEGWVTGRIGQFGPGESTSGAALRYRQCIGAGRIPIFADILDKHRSEKTVDLVKRARAISLHRADMLVLTGDEIGLAPSLDQLKELKAAVDLPLFAGSGVSADNLRDLYGTVDGFIVGSAMKEGGRWNAPVCQRCVERVVGAIERARTAHRETLPRN